MLVMSWDQNLGCAPNPRQSQCQRGLDAAPCLSEEDLLHAADGQQPPGQPANKIAIALVFSCTSNLHVRADDGMQYCNEPLLSMSIMHTNLNAALCTVRMLDTAATC